MRNKKASVFFENSCNIVTLSDIFNVDLKNLISDLETRLICIFVQFEEINLEFS